MTSTPTDSALWHACQAGDREAFGTLVARYQSLVASVAYSRTGNLAASQDVAQETFVTAWRQLPQLRDPLLLRSWLCGIARNLTASAARTERRRGGPPAPLDDILEPPAREQDPEAQAVSREEESLLWQALAGLPESVREPLVLFYREEQSVSEVAEKLELSEPAVRQRLSRGRAMLREELAATVESVLTRSRPNAAFTAAVMAAIAVAVPIPAMAAGLGVGAAAGKSTAAGVGAGVVAGPAAGFATAWLASKAVGLNARSEDERALVARAFRSAWLFVAAAIALLLAALFVGGASLRQSPWLLVAVTTGWTVGLLAYLLRHGNTVSREIRAVRVATGTVVDEFAPAPRTRYVSRARLLGVPLFAYGSSGLDAGAKTSSAVRAWIAIGDFAISPLIAIGGLAIAPIAIGGVTIGVLSLSIAGLAAGVLAVGSISVGWWAFGGAAVGWSAAAGGVAIARDYAIGGIVRAAEANTTLASAWFADQWFNVPVLLFAVAIPVLIALSIVVPLTLLFRRGLRRRAAMAAAIAPAAPPSERIHGLDALRAVALTCGILLHASVAFILPGGAWAVGTVTSQPFLGWLVYYLHAFRLETFFLLAGFFGALVVSRRGAATFARDRAIRLGLVFVVFLAPMKYVLAALWITGGRVTGWLQLPPVISDLPWYLLALGAFTEESWPAVSLTHLWFLYTLSCVIAIGLAVRAIARRVTSPTRLASLSQRVRSIAAGRAWPWILACAVTPVLAQMTGMDVDTPDRSFVWHVPVTLLCGTFFGLGWWLHGHRDLLATFAARSTWWVSGGILVSLVTVIGVATRHAGGDWATTNADALRWATSFGTSLTMALSVFGWIGFFVRRVPESSAGWRYFADASYWIYIVHLPVVVGLQIALSKTGLAWWIQVPLITVVTLGITLTSYHWLVRNTWVGRWINGRLRRRE